MSIAEDCGLIEQMDMWVLHEACQMIQEWHVTFPDQPLTIGSNLSARLFAQDNLAMQIQLILASTKICPSKVRLEITESMTMRDTERAIKTMQAIRAMGVQLSIDDFGTAYSSLSYLHRFPVDTLKIDRSFVSGMDQSPECMQIINSIMSLARSLGLNIIAEGPETAAHVKQLQAMGCDYGQGYHFSKPVSAIEIEQMLQFSKIYNL